MLSTLGFQPSTAPAAVFRLARLFRGTPLIEMKAPPTNSRLLDSARALTAALGEARNDVSTAPFVALSRARRTSEVPFTWRKVPPM